MRNTAHSDYSAAVSTITYEVELIIAEIFERINGKFSIEGHPLAVAKEFFRWYNEDTETCVCQ